MWRFVKTFLKYLLIVFLCNCTFFVFGQKKYTEGFIVRNSEDTLKGLLKFKSLRTGSAVCLFKKHLDNEIEKFLPHEIKSFGTDSTIFESRREYLRREQKLGNSNFLKVVFDGKLNIFLGKGNQFFIGTDTSTNVYLLNKKDYLYYLTNDQIELRPQIKNMRFNEESFIRLMKSYHNSMGIYDYEFYQHKLKPANLDLFIFGGYNLSFLKMTQSELNDPKNFSKSYSPTFGYRIEYFPPSRSVIVKFSINLQNLFYKELFQHQSITQIGSSYSNLDILYESFVIEVPLGFKVQKKLNNKISTYIMPGVSMRKTIPVESRSITDVVVGNEITTIYKEIEYLQLSTFPVFLSVGMLKRFSNKNQIFLDIKSDLNMGNSLIGNSLSISAGYKIFSKRFNE